MSLKEFKDEIQGVDNCQKTICYIPSYQRNYKWSDSETERNGAGRLILDIIEKYSKDNNADFNLGMITTYNDESDRIQILDGQQRLITLSLIMKALGKANKNDWIELQFERDINFDNVCKYINYNEFMGTTRYNFIYGEQQEEDCCVDVQRMKNNFDKIEKIINGKTCNKFKDNLYNYIINHVKILHHKTSRQPIDEFLNMNFNKTPFCAADYMKANMIFDTIQVKNTTGNKNENITITEIMMLWRKLHHSLYQLENVFNKNDLLENDMFQLIKQHYKQLDKNRMEILFEDRYYKMEEINCESYYGKDEDRLRLEYNYLEKSYNIMKDLLNELLIIDAEGNYHPNYTAYSAYNLLCHKNSEVTFFKMFDGSDDVGETLYKEFNLIKKSYYKLKDSMVNVNQFMESMLVSNSTLSDSSQIKRISKNTTIDIENFENYKKMFDDKFGEFTNIINVGKKAEEPLFSTENMTVTLRELLSSKKIKEVKIPQVQRDYVMGSNQRYLECYLTKMRFEELCQKGEALPDDMLQSFSDIIIEEIKCDNITEHDINCLYRSFVINRQRKDLPNIDFGTYISFFENILLPHEVEAKETGREHRFKELNKWLKKINKKCIDAPKDYKKYSNKTLLGKNLGLRNRIIKCIKCIHEKCVKNEIDYKGSRVKMNTSCIMGHIDEYGTLWIYDGQQRITTSIILLAYGLMKADIEETEKNKLIQIMNKFSFEGRYGANQMLKAIIMKPKMELEILQTFIEDNTSFAIYRFWLCLNGVEKKINTDWKHFIEISPKFILDGMDFEFVLMEHIEDAEQLFIEMNEGLKLKEEEKYKAELNYVMNKSKHVKQKCFSLKMDNDWLDKCGSEEKEVTWLKYAITMAYFEVNGYDSSRTKDSLVGVTEEILNLAMESMNCFDLEMNCTCDIERNIKDWCSTLKYNKISEYYSDRIKLNLCDLQELLNKVFKFKDKNMKDDYYAECFRLISQIRKNGYLFINQEIENDSKDKNKSVEAEILVYNLLKNRQDRYNFYNIKLWEDFSYIYDNEKYHKDYYLEKKKLINYELSDVYLSYFEKCDGDIKESDILEGMEKIVNNWLGIFDKKETGENGETVKFCFRCTEDKKSKIMEAIKESTDKGVIIGKINDIFNREIGSGECLNKSNCNVGEDIKTYKFEIKLEDIVNQIKTYNTKSGLYKKNIYQLGIKRGYYRVIQNNGTYMIEDRRKQKDDLSVCPYLKQKETISELEIVQCYNDLLFVLKNCAKSVKEQIKEEIVKCYLEEPEKHAEYAYQTKEYLKEQCDEICQNPDSCLCWSNIYKDKEKLKDYKILRVLSENMAEKLGVIEYWNKHSGIKHLF